MTLAQYVVTYQRLGDLDTAVQMVRARSGGAYDPRHAAHFCAHATTLMQGLDAEPSWDQMLACEPGKRRALTEAQLDTACQALADFADLKSPYMLGHSPAVAKLAMSAARAAGLSEAEGVTLRRAGWLHDLGRVGVSAGVWAKPGPLSEREWDQVRLHPYYTERELEVLRLIARGQSIKQMALRLTISPKTVDSHIQHIYEKLGVSTRAGATLFAVDHDLLTPTA